MDVTRSAGISPSPPTARKYRARIPYYTRYLHRPAVPSEVAFWVNALVQGGTNEQLVTGFVASDEFYQ